MTVETSNKPSQKYQRDPDLVNAEIAMHRAARKAREIARKTGVPVVYIQDGEIREDPGNDHATTDR